MYKVQSVVIKKVNNNDLQKSANWIINNGFIINKVDETKNYFRFRQLDPSKLRKQGYAHYITKPIANDVSLIIAYK